MAGNGLKPGSEGVSEHPPHGPGSPFGNTRRRPCVCPFSVPGMGHLKAFRGPDRASKRSKRGSKQPQSVSVSTPEAQFRPWSDPFWTHFGGHWGPSCGCFFFGGGGGQTTHHSREKNGPNARRRPPQVARVDSVPRRGRTGQDQTPAAPNPKPSGPVRGRLEAQPANRCIRREGNTHHGVQQDPADGCLGSRDPSGGPQNPNGELQFLVPVLGASCLPAAAAG